MPSKLIDEYFKNEVKCIEKENKNKSYFFFLNGLWYINMLSNS